MLTSLEASIEHQDIKSLSDISQRAKWEHPTNLITKNRSNGIIYEDMKFNDNIIEVK